MGDRTFSSNDVLRIFEFYLDSAEQDVVREFFREPSDISLAILDRLLTLLLDLVQLLGSPVIGLLVSVFPAIIIDQFGEIQRALISTNRALAREIGRIDA